MASRILAGYLKEGEILPSNFEGPQAEALCAAAGGKIERREYFRRMQGGCAASWMRLCIRMPDGGIRNIEADQYCNSYIPT